jgi:two-component system, NarL family, response regulator
VSAPARPIQVLLVDDHPVILEGLAALIAQSPRMAVVAQAERGLEAVQAYERHRPDVTLADLSLPDMTGAELIARVRARHPDACFLVLTIHGGAEDIYRAVQAGCRGYLLKNAPREELFRAIETVRSGARYFPPEVASRLAERTAMDDLTPREQEVLSLLAAGKRDREIALGLGLSQATVRSHLSSILSKLGVNSRTQAILAAIELGLVRKAR